MDFSIKKPTHILALLAMTLVFCITIGLPILTFFNYLPSTPEGIQSVPAQLQILFEIILVGLQLSLIIVLFIGVPILWYVLVNRLSIKSIFERLQLKKQEIPQAILWGGITMICSFIMIVIIDIFLLAGGFDPSKQSNIEDLEKILSLPSMVVIISIQPIAEEFFFRGFLLEKINSWKGPTTAVVLPSILFGIAHLSYGKIYPLVMTGIVGAFLAFFVIKTKNLLTGVLAHIFFNITSITLYYLTKNFFP
ncbi:MAG: type II CAAX endopeptidase family protein [Candidatus Thermoplasmatota archaeon]